MSGIVSEVSPLGTTQNPLPLSSNLLKSNDFFKKHVDLEGILHPSVPLPRYFEELNELRIIRDRRDTRYSLRWQIKNRFMDIGRKLGLLYPSAFHRTAKCGSVLISNSVGLYHGIEHKRAFFTGLSTCGNVWTCPVCSAKIQERRRIEISKAMEWAYANGYKCVMVTLTNPHTSSDKLSDLLTKQADSLRLIRSGREWSNYKEKIGFVGLIRSLELTVGENGWHPHTHELWIVNQSCDVEELKKITLKRWENACIKTGILSDEKLEDFRLRSVNIKDNATNSDYLAKFDESKSWGIDRELAKGSSKSSRSGCHPFELLCECAGNLPMSKEVRGDMFIEYAMAMHGKRQLYWSQGLKKLVGIIDKTDEEICEEPDEIAILLGQISEKRWRLVLNEVAEAEILYRAETGGWKKVEEWFLERGS